MLGQHTFNVAVILARCEWHGSLCFALRLPLRHGRYDWPRVGVNNLHSVSKRWVGRVRVWNIIICTNPYHDKLNKLLKLVNIHVTTYACLSDLRDRPIALRFRRFLTPTLTLNLTLTINHISSAIGPPAAQRDRSIAHIGQTCTKSMSALRGNILTFLVKY